MYRKTPEKYDVTIRVLSYQKQYYIVTCSAILLLPVLVSGPVPSVGVGPTCGVHCRGELRSWCVLQKSMLAISGPKSHVQGHSKIVPRSSGGETVTGIRAAKIIDNVFAQS